MNRITIAFALFVFLILCAFPMVSYCNTVRTIYFSPADVPVPTDEFVSKMRDVMVSVQRFYSDEMEKHGYGSKTFKLETDNNGRVAVHSVVGKRNLQAYSDLYLVEQELPPDLQDTFKVENKIRVIFLGGADQVGNGAITDTFCRGDVCGHTVFIPASNAALLMSYTAHEIGHAFGLNHNSGGPNFVMKPTFVVINNEEHHLDDYDLADYEARWLDKHRYFNNQHSVDSVPRIVRVHRLVPLEIERRDTILFLVDVSGDNELHQVQISRIHDGMIVGWDKICDMKDSAKIHVGRPKLLGSDKVRILVIDVMGNIKGHVMPVVLPSRTEGVTPQVGKTDGNGVSSILWAVMKHH